MAVDDLDRVDHHLVAPGHIVGDRFLDEPVRRRQREVDRHRGRDRAVRVVRRHRDRVRLGHRRDLARFPEPAAVREIGLDDMAGAPLEQLAELGPPTSRSPVAIGMRDCRVTCAVASMSSVGQGSSKKSSPYGSSAWQYSIAIAGQVRAWRSTIRSISSPTASRIAST